MKLAAALLSGVLLTATLTPATFVPAWAAAPGQPENTYVPPLADPVLEARAKSLQKELRCLVCQGQSIDESAAELATDLKKLIREQIQSGMSDQQIKDFLVVRYGVFILMQPPVQSDTYFLWFVPAVLILIGGAGIAVTVMRSKRRLATDATRDDLETQA